MVPWCGTLTWWYTTNKLIVSKASFSGYNLNIVHPPHDYAPILQNLNLLSLADCRNARDLTFFQNIIGGKIDFPSLLQHISFRVPTRYTRNIAPFAVPLCTTNYLKNEPLTRCMRQAIKTPPSPTKVEYVVSSYFRFVLFLILYPYNLLYYVYFHILLLLIVNTIIAVILY